MVFPWRDKDETDVARIIDSNTNGEIQDVDEHEQLLMKTCPYTDAEREQVAALCEEERAVIRDYYFGGTVNLTGERYRIARERVKISRAARVRLGRGA